MSPTTSNMERSPPYPFSSESAAESSWNIAPSESAAGRATSPSLCTFLRKQAGQLLDWAINAELEVFLLRWSTISDARGRPAVVRNGYQPARELVTSLGPVTIRIPKVRSRTERPAVFRSMLARPYLRRSHTSAYRAPAQFLRGLGNGDLHAALSALMGPDAAALPAPVMQRLAFQWSRKHKGWLTGSLAQLDCTALWMESLRCDEDHPDPLGSVMMAVGIDGAARERILAVTHGVRETAKSWSELLTDLRRRGLPPPAQLRLGKSVPCTVAQVAAAVYPETLHID